MEGTRRSKPSFFKVLFSEDFTRQLRLPTAFVKKHGELLPENAVLRASSGKSWAVKLEHTEDEECYFTQGWPKFVEDLGLRMGEFLLFRLAGKSIIHVSVYGISGCEREISDCKSEFESSDSAEEVEILSADCGLAKRSYRAEAKNKRAKTSFLEEKAARNHGNVDYSSPLYFEIVLKKHHRSRVSLRVKFAEVSGLIGQKRVVLEYVPKQHFTSVELDRKPGFFRLDMAWSGFIKENGLIFGRTYSFEFNPRKNVIQVDEIKK
ncbi:B3 domain-containing protein REM17-like isoform X1 [Primulina tabacum]|uniref:B3 domain-containing protein REM17-like isoform X1 n=1 Tax=Primulina tabacum TaxID=48773 RepID=UPI003F5A28E6